MRHRVSPRIVLSGLLAAFVATTAFGFALFGGPRQARAQLASPFDPVIAAGTNITASQAVTQTGLEVKASTFELITANLLNTAALAILNAGNYFVQKIAYDAANYIASGGKGQTPFFTTDTIGDYLTNTAKDAAGEALGTLSQADGFAKLGINLCAPTNPRVVLNIKLGFMAGLVDRVGPLGPSQPQPRCPWNQIRDNWTQFSQLDSDTVLSQVGVMFTPGESSLSAAIQFNQYARNLISKRQEEAINKYIADSGFKDLTAKISGKVLTPADTIRAEMTRVNQEAAESGKDLMIGMTPAAFGKGAFGILPAALNTFTNTLSEKLMRRIFERGLIALSSIGGSAPEDSVFSFDGAGSSGGGRATAELANASLLTPKILTVANYNELTEFAACPNDGKTPNNCVMDTQFFTAVSRGGQGAALTVRQAVEQGLLHGDWPLLPLTHQRNRDADCHRSAYCYSNLLKLRRARIIPIGWELAANSTFNDPNRPVTLREAMDRFNDCPLAADGSIDVDSLPNGAHPWCHMIDPNWVLKYPDAICRQQAPGPTPLSSESNIRAQACVDVATCVAEDASGNCVGGYGYCVQEKSVWKMDADSCPAYYASCQTVRRRDGGSFSYLSNTLESGACNSDNAGCLRYSTSPNAVPNGGFEDVLNGQARDWTLDPGAVFDRSGTKGFLGDGAVGVAAGSSARAQILSLQSGTRYRLSGAALLEDEAIGAAAAVTVSFRDLAGNPAGQPQIDTTCNANLTGTAVTLDLAPTHLGHAVSACDVTVPQGVVSGEIVVSSGVPATNRVWFDELGLTGAGAWSAAPQESLYLNAKAQGCPAGEAGCTEFVRVMNGNLNLVRNPSFEDLHVPTNTARFWSMAPAQYENAQLRGSHGTSSAVLTTAPIRQDVLRVAGDAVYSFSIDTRYDGTDNNPPDAEARLQLYDASGTPDPVPPVTTAGDCEVIGNAVVVALPTGTEYRRATCQLVTPADTGFLRLALASDSDARRVLVDSVQFELAVNATAFHAGYAQNAERVYLKKAPEGLTCSGGPTDPAECAQYAPACRRDEVGCESYAPENGGVSIPAVTNVSDFCPAACSGYDAFRQEGTRFNDARFPVFIVPSTADVCAAAEAGCSEFTNIERLAQGGEAREYYSSLRLCARPNDRAATYYTWEGNDASGFQLRVWNLLRSNIASSPATGPDGSDPTGGNAPCTALRYDAAGNAVCADDIASVDAASCSRSELSVNPDCREFYDADGNIHYRVYAQTVVVTEDCTEYRITRSTEAECAAHGGRWFNSECRYFGFAAESQTCRAAAAGCRAYAGSASRNVRIAMTNAFESGTTDGWTAAPGGGATTDVVNSNESVTAGGHSLRVTRPDVHKDVSQTLRRDRTYLLTFWAKGTGDLAVRFSAAGDRPFTVNRATGADQPVTLTTDWRPYTVGPVTVVRDPASNPADASLNEQLVFERLGGGAPLLYLDNIELREATDNLYLIEDSWENPAVCDQTPLGAPAPQYMLGCQAYRTRSDAQVHLRSFDRICRPEAVGCEALYDTRHSASPFAETWNAVCRLASSCVPTGGAVTCPCVTAGETACQVTLGQTECRYDADDEVPSANVSASGDTVRISADRLTYLVNDGKYRCDRANASCTAVAEMAMNLDRNMVESWNVRTVRNDPATYERILCRNEELYCEAWTRGTDGAPLYFKDPKNRTCEFRQNQGAGGLNVSGWFKKGTTEPCYPDYFQAGSFYGIWKNSDALFDHWAGECQPQYDQCKEFIDPNDISADFPTGRPYYALVNDRLDTRSCQNRVSLLQSPASAADASACVLFRQSDNLNLTFSATATYAASDAARGALVAPVDGGAQNDANIIIKVRRDRQCGAWLDCRTTENVYNPSTGAYQSVCSGFGLCVQYERVGNTSRCVRYADSTFSGDVLTEGLYQGRETGWKGTEYSGYAVPNRYPVQEMVTINVSADSVPEHRLVYLQGSCAVGAAYGSACGPTNNRGFRGTCVGPSSPRLCAYPIDGSRSITTAGQFEQPQSVAAYPSVSCRAYPQDTAPFPSSVADPNGWNYDVADANAGNPLLIGAAPAFAGVNVCQRMLVGGVETSTCECNYQIARYGSAMTRYFPAEQADLPTGYCQGGSFENYECDPLATGARTKANLSCCIRNPEDSTFAGCDDGAQCVRLNKVDRVVGYEGQCLERDVTTPINNRADQFACATWRPVTLVGGTRDIYNQHQTAGYFAAADRRFYCVGPKERWIMPLNINATEDVNGDGAVDPNDQPTMNFFGPGVVSAKIDHYQSQGGNCSHDADSLSAGGGWCLYPGISESVAVAEDDNATKYGLTGNALGILGCYEVSDNTKGLAPSIIWPYIGPPMYRDQLDAIYFQISDDIYYYGDGDQESIEETDPGGYGDVNTGGAKIRIEDTDDFAADTGRIPTNPFQNVFGDCNDDGEDSIDPTEDNNQDHLVVGNTPLADADAVKPGHQFPVGTNGAYYIHAGNNWQGDFSDNEGAIALEAKFDRNGKFTALELHAVDNSDEGTFAINSMGFVFKPGCQQIAQVDQPGEFGLTRAYTDAVNIYQTYSGADFMHDVFGEPRDIGDACRPFGAVGAVAKPPTDAAGAGQQPWTYVASRRTGEFEQCTVTDFVRSATYRSVTPEAAPQPEWMVQTIRRLFRQVFRLWDYRELRDDAGGNDYAVAGGAYDETGLVDGAALILRGHGSIFGGINWGPPRIASVETASCESNGRCTAGNLDSLTVNGREEGVLVGAEGAMTVSARFYAWASHNAMPIIARNVFWGDYAPKEPPAKGWYKNQKPFCSPDSSNTNAAKQCSNGAGLTCDSDDDCPTGGTCEDVGGHFGNTPGACSAAPFQFDHVYTCTLKDLQALPECSGPADRAANAPCYRRIATVPTCVYRPRVQVIDNWGWCNCTGSGCAVDGGAYRSACAISNAPANAEPWTEFDGEIRLAPRQQDAAAFVPGGGGGGGPVLPWDFDPGDMFFTL